MIHRLTTRSGVRIDAPTFTGAIEEFERMSSRSLTPAEVLALATSRRVLGLTYSTHDNPEEPS